MRSTAHAAVALVVALLSLLCVQIATADPPSFVADDVGTIGGSGSAATAINDAGLVVGWSTGSFFTARPVTWSEAAGITAMDGAPAEA